jgi:hypothetical protein
MNDIQVPFEIPPGVNIYGMGNEAYIANFEILAKQIREGIQTQSLSVTGTVGFFGATPVGRTVVQAQPALAATASFPDVDNRLETLRDKLNELQAALRALGIV